MNYTLADLFEKPISGEWGTEVTEGEKGVKVIRTTNFTNLGRLNLSKVVVRNIDTEKYKNKALRYGDIIIEKSGGSPTQPVGRVVVFEENTDEKYFCNNFTSILRPTELVNYKYSLYLLKDLYNKGEVLRYQNKTTGIINIRINEYIQGTEVTVPNKDVQQKIAEALDKAQYLIDKRREQIDGLDELIQSVFYDMFGHPIRNPMKWDNGKIADVIIRTQYGSSSKADGNKGEFEMLRMNNITYKGDWDFSSIKYVDLDKKDQGKYLVYKGEVLFNRTNSKELVGKTAEYKRDKPMAYAGYLIKMIPNNRANGTFIATYMNTKYTKTTLFNMAKSIVGMANINAEELKKIDIYIPPIELQNKFANIVENIEQQKELMQQSLTQLENNFNLIMQKAFNGELFS